MIYLNKFEGDHYTKVLFRGGNDTSSLKVQYEQLFSLLGDKGFVYCVDYENRDYSFLLEEIACIHKKER